MEKGATHLALVLFLLVLIVILSVLIVVLVVVLILVFVLTVVLLVLVLVLVVILVLHNECSFFVIWELRTHYAHFYSRLFVARVLDCHSKRSSKAYNKDANAIVDATTIGTDIHQSHG